jgi:hypothetical protein
VTADLSWAEFDDAFQRFADSPTSTTVFRWEARAFYSIPADEPSLVAFRTGAPRPERSVRTSPWLARIATSTAAGKEWLRVRHVADATDEYLRWELLAYVESQAVGERILLTRDPERAAWLPDFWLFDGDDPADRYAVVMHYADDGTVDWLEYVTDRDRLVAYHVLRDAVVPGAVELNAYLAPRREVSGAA